MSSFFKKFLSSSTGGDGGGKSGKQSSTSSSNNRMIAVESEAKKKKLSRRLALAQADPEPLLDLTDFELNKLDDQVLMLVKVYHKQKLHLERNRLACFVGSAHFANVTVLHLEENQICSFECESTLNLKELYLSVNRLITLDSCKLTSCLPRLKVLSLRSNQLKQFPLDLILGLPELVYCDLAFNRIEALPAELVWAKIKLQTLIIEGNPLRTPELGHLVQRCEDANSFVEITLVLREYFRLHHEEVNKEEIEKTTKEFIDLKEKNVNNEKDEDENEDEHGELDNHFKQIVQRKIETKQNCIEWERNQQLRHEAKHTEVTASIGGVKSTTATREKDKLLNELCDEQRELMERIDLFHCKKLADRQKRLEEYIHQLKEHSSKLIEKLSIDSILKPEKKIGQEVDRKDAEEKDNIDDEVNEDIRELLDRYDEKLRLKRTDLLEHLQSASEVASQKLNESFQLKDSMHTGLYKELERQEEALSFTFDRLLAARDRKNVDLMNKISLVEQELLALTFCERERKELRSDARISELEGQRARLVELLTSLLEVKRTREKMLKETLQKELLNRFRMNSEPEESWLVQVQRFLSQESFEVQVQHYNLDVRLANILISLYYDLEDDNRYSSDLKTKLTYFLPHFVDIPYETLLVSAAADLMSKCTISDYELCRILEARFADVLYNQKNTVHCVVASSPDIMNKSERNVSTERAESESATEKTEQTSKEKDEAEESSNGNFWYEIECVICLTNKPNIVFLPCGHICTCQHCIRPNASILGECPLCRVEIDFMQSINTTTTA